MAMTRTIGRLTRMFRSVFGMMLVVAVAAGAQGTVPIRDVVSMSDAPPIRLVGYGLVTGLTGTGDQTGNGRSSVHTVQSVANLLRRFDISIPPELLRTRNVAAVLVTAEVTPWLRPGGRFDVHVASVGDARSLRGGVLWMTPLVAEASGPAMATAQGPMLVDDIPVGVRRRAIIAEASGRIPSGGVLELDLPRPAAPGAGRLYLRQPDIATATRIAQVIDSVIGRGTARVEDPGSVAVTVADSAWPTMLTRIGDLPVQPTRPSRIVIDANQGTVVAGGDLTVGPGIVSVAGITVSIGTQPGDTARVSPSGALLIRAGSRVEDLAAVLLTVRTPASVIARIFEALREAGAITAEVVSR
jgi:flagellar P-ring protein precursor FlgI